MKISKLENSLVLRNHLGKGGTDKQKVKISIVPSGVALIVEVGEDEKKTMYSVETRSIVQDVLDHHNKKGE